MGKEGRDAVYRSSATKEISCDLPISPVTDNGDQLPLTGHLSFDPADPIAIRLVIRMPTGPSRGRSLAPCIWRALLGRPAWATSGSDPLVVADGGSWR